MSPRRTFQLLPASVLLAVFVVWMCFTLASCASMRAPFTDPSPSAALEVKDPATCRGSSDPFCFIGIFWVKVKFVMDLSKWSTP